MDNFKKGGRANIKDYFEVRFLGLFLIGLSFCLLFFEDEQQISLKPSATGWLYYPKDRNSKFGAILFHGANPLGSHQASARILIQALRNAGFVVLAVDHPGYGKSPNNSNWDPLPTQLAAYEYLHQLSNIQQILAVGHSMGAVDVLRLLQSKKSFLVAVLLGSTSCDSPKKDVYWYKRFIEDRNLQLENLPFDQFIEIKNSFYDADYYAKNLPLDHSPLLFVNFGVEHKNVVKRRGQLFDLIPGQKQKWDLNFSNHQLNSYLKGPFLIGDVRVYRELVKTFSELKENLTIDQSYKFFSSETHSRCAPPLHKEAQKT